MNPCRNRSLACPEAVPRLEFSYDYQGRRASKTVYSWSGTNWTEDTETTFLYDSWNLIKEVGRTVPGEPSCETNINYYTWGLDLSGSLQGAGGIGGLIARTTDTNTYFYTADANGNVSELLTDTGEIAAHYVEAKRKSDRRRKYDPYGSTLVSEGELASDNVYRFSTKYTDTETKLLYYGFRYYSPELGRWLSRDPIEERGGINIYAFLKNALGSCDFIGLAVFEIQFAVEKVGEITIKYDDGAGGGKCPPTPTILGIYVNPPGLPPSVEILSVSLTGSFEWEVDCEILNWDGVIPLNFTYTAPEGSDAWINPNIEEEVDESTSWAKSVDFRLCKCTMKGDLDIEGKIISEVGSP